MLRKSYLLAVVMVGGVCGPAASASAWTAAVTDGQLVVGAAAGEANRVSVDVAPDGNLVVTDDAGAPSALGAGCSDPNGEGTATCARTGVTGVTVTTGDLDDTVSITEVGLPATVSGGGGNDELAGSSSNDIIDAGAGNDTIDAGAGDDRITAGAGDDSVAAGTGDDVVDLGDGDDTADLDLGNDRAVGGAGTDQSDGGAGNDTVDGGDGADSISGGDGDDALTGAAGQDVITGDAGNDTIDGGDDADDLDGSAGADAVSGGAGNDQLASTEGGDRLDGGDGNDQLTGDDLGNVLLGGAGDDALAGFGGADTLDGGDGNDTLDGGLGPDGLTGRAGRDTVSYEQALAGVTVTLNGFADDGAPGEGDNVSADVENVLGSAGDDTIVAGPASLEVHGGAGNDRITGSPLADLLDGGDGDDVLDGGAGPDVLTGGAGLDTVTYANRSAGVRVSIGNLVDDGQPGEADDVRADVDRVIGTPFDDELSAVRGLSVRLDGLAGDDTLRLPVIGASDDDALQEQPGTGACGKGTDTVYASSEDRVLADCDIVITAGRLTRMNVHGDPSPRLRIYHRRIRLGDDNRLRVPVTCQTRTLRECRVRLRVSRNGNALGRVTGTAKRGAFGILRVALVHQRATVRRLLRDGGTVRLEVAVTDSARTEARGAASVIVGPRSER